MNRSLYSVMQPNTVLSVLVVLMPLFIGCSVGDGGTPLPASLGDCPDDSVISWADVEPAFAANCTRCHHFDLTGGARRAAPRWVDYDTPERAMDAAAPEESWRQIAEQGMPSDQPISSAEDALLIWEWYSCGGPL